MAINPITYTEKIVRSFLKYQLSAYPFTDERLHEQMRELLNMDKVRRTPLLNGPFVSLSRSFLEGASVASLIEEGGAPPAHAADHPSPHHPRLWAPGGGRSGDPRRQNDAREYRNGFRQDGGLPLSDYQQSAGTEGRRRRERDFGGDRLPP